MKKIALSIIIVLFFIGVCCAGTTETSGITAQTIITRVERYLDIADDPLYSDNDFIQWIDEAVRETVNRTGCLEASPITVALVANTYRYDPGQSFLRVVSIEHDNGDTADKLQIMTLDRVNINDLGHNKEKGRPKVYAVWNDQIVIWPIPRTDEAGTSLYVYTVSLPTGIVATTDAIETPAYFDMAIINYVAAMAHFKNNQMVKGASFLNLYEQRIAEYNALVLHRNPVE